MVKLTVFVKNGTAKVTLPEPAWVRGIMVKNATVFWRHRNNDPGVYINVGSIKTYLPGGYVTFEELAELMETISVKLTRRPGGKCRIEVGGNGTIIPSELSKMLGFNGKLMLVAASVTDSPDPVDMLNGLRYITVRCNKVNPREPDIVSLPTVTNPAGCIERYVDVESFVATGGITASDFTLTVHDQDGTPYTYCDVLLDVYVT